MKYGFIGAGNMGGAILKGFIESGNVLSKDVYVCDSDPERRKTWQELLLVNTTDDIETLVDSCDIIILGIKPNGFDAVMPLIANKWEPTKILISMAAGISIEFMENYLPVTAKIIRIMPNTPAMVGESMVAVCRNRNISDLDMEAVFKIFISIGRAEEVSEELIHCVIGVSGSSPAYTYMYIDALIDAAVNNGMDREKATIFAAQSVLGAAKMVLETGISPEQLRINVCSPGGTTIEAVNALFENGFQGNVAEGFQAAVEKSKAMTK